MSRFHNLLRINLSDRSFINEEIPPEYEKKYLGGKGLATFYLANELKPHIDPLGADNKFIIGAGPLCGTTAPASSRYEIVTKSPLTGIYLDCNSGGHLAQEVKSAGHDLIIIEGVSESAVIIYINNSSVSFLDASDVWGEYIYETENHVRRLLKDPALRIMAIGPAGENLVRFASVSNDYSRQAARGGSGAVLGSKKVKAIAIRGSRDIPLANHSSFLRAVEKANRIIFENPWVPLQRRYGTPRSVAPVNAAGLLPVNNFTGGNLESVAVIDEVAWEKLTVKRLSCGECPVACSKGYARDNISLEGPEYETIALFGPNLGITDPAEIAEFNYYCNQYGMDTISAGALLGAYFASGLSEAGKDKRAGRKAPGSEPPYRQPGSRSPSRRAIIELLGNIAYRRGIGHTLARGLRSAGEELKITHLMPEIKGLGLPAYDPRGTDGTALVYMTADRGACHLRSWPLGRELSGEIDKDDPSAVVAFVKKQQDEKAAEESLIVCQFAYGIGLLNGILAELVNEATGEDWDLEKMRLAGERCWNISRLFNNREGITRKDDYLPQKFAVEGIAAGPLKGRKVDREKQDLLLDEYYRRRGWTKEGIPESATLNRLGIEGII